jgi:Dolichyl-phosphate-mannose-protein mannosyltransferase
MFSPLRNFKIGKPQVLAGLLLLLFLAQCFWVASSRKFSDLEYEYIASGYHAVPSQSASDPDSPFTGLMAALPLRFLFSIKNHVPASWKPALAIPRPWVARLPFVVFGVWLGGALWWVARRLFGDTGGYIALALFCFSPALVMISANIGPEIILAWSSFGLVYTAIGVAHTVYAPPRKWIPRIIILGAAIGICLSTTLWSFTIVLLAFAFMLYLAPGRRSATLIVLSGASVLGLAILALVTWLVHGKAAWAMITPRPGVELIHNLGFVFADAYSLPSARWITAAQEVVLLILLVSALTIYGSWGRARYFGNTAPLVTAFAVVLLFALVPAIHIVEATLGLSFLFLFIAGVSADLLETSSRRILSFVLAAILIVRAVLGLSLLRGWIHQNPM